jgi:hypothetical protein
MPDSTIRLKQISQSEISGYCSQVTSGILANVNTVVAPTGKLTGAFYPLNSNPQNYAKSGDFSTQTDIDGSIAQNNAYINSTYYPRTNPSGYVSTTSNIVLLTGNQTVSGVKSFVNGISGTLTSQTITMGYPNIGYAMVLIKSDGVQPAFSVQQGNSYPLFFINTAPYYNIGIKTESPNYTLDVNGSGNFSQSLRVGENLSVGSSSSSGSFTLGIRTLYVYTGASSGVATMPSIASSIDRMYLIKNRGNTLTLSGAGSDFLFYNSGTKTFPLYSGDAYILCNDGSFWNIM